jgi:hypothetical protein
VDEAKADGAVDSFITLTPCIPLSLKGEREDDKKEGRQPLLDTPYILTQN